MIHLCQNKGCKNIASCSCLCKTEARYYCSDHFKSHLLEDLTAQHQIQPCYIDISSNEKAAIITKAQTMIRTLADYKRKVILHSIE